MPFEPIYGFPYEAPSDVPGWSLTGGPEGDQPVLAERVAAQLRRLDDLMQALTDSFGSYPQRIQAGYEAGVMPDTPVTSAFYNDTYWRGTRDVTFAGAFEFTTPSVVVCANSGVPGIVIECSASAVNTVGFTINIARSSQTATGVFWIASEQTQP